MLQVLSNAQFGIPAILIDFAKEAVALHHPGKALAVVFKVDEITVSEALCPAGQLLREDVGVHVNLEHSIVGFLCAIRQMVCREDTNHMRLMPPIRRSGGNQNQIRCHERTEPSVTLHWVSTQNYP
jgi:hypothetical protein